MALGYTLVVTSARTTTGKMTLGELKAFVASCEECGISDTTIVETATRGFNPIGIKSLTVRKSGVNNAEPR